jgi:hypothetical protein
MIRNTTLSLTQHNTLPHATQHSLSRNTTLSLTQHNTLPHATQHSPSRNTTLSLTHRHMIRKARQGWNDCNALVVDGRSEPHQQDHLQDLSRAR